MTLFEKWVGTKNSIKELTEKLHELEGQIWLKAEASGDLNLKGSKTFHQDDYSVTITHGETVKVDQKFALTRPDLFKVKYEFDRTQYKNLVESQKEFVDEAITITPSKPQFKIVKKEIECE
ncbi:MAG: hypothetical protein RIQ94_178 [Pseudomonadota bacterium]